MEKLQVYYQPAKNDSDNLKSLTISLYDFDEKTITYREKIVLERGGEKYKIKKWWGQLGAIKPFLDQLDLSQYKSSGVNPDDAYFYVTHGDKVFSTSKREDIEDILQFCHFDAVMNYDLSQYQKCD